MVTFANANWGHTKGEFLMKASVYRWIARVLGAVSLSVLVSCSAATSGTPAAGVSDAGPARSYIVEGETTDAAADAVIASGGRVTSRLGVIDAVEADLTDAEHARVLKAPRVKQITTNSIVMTQAAANVRDNFETSALTNNDGDRKSVV